jgi:hypothetical protein
MFRANVGWLAAAAGWGITVGCGGTTEVITPPPPPPTDFVIEFRADSGDASTAQSLGWQNGIPDVDVTIRPEDTTKGGSQALRGTTQGRLVLTGVSPGSYVIDASRWLGATDVGNLVAGDDAIGFVTKQVVRVIAGGQATVPLFGSRRRGLVISEWAFNQKGSYTFSGFLELYNNGDTTAYLDGMVIGEGFWASLDAPNFPCSHYASFRNDPEGIWTREFARFPGTGRDYPVPPGTAVVVATDGIDHRPFIAGGLDLSRADFEFVGTADVDNPAVPNLEDLSLHTSPSGHGLSFWTNVVVPFLARPLDVAALVRRAPDGGKFSARIPRAAVVDVFTLGTYYLAGLPDCPPLVTPLVDRQESRVRGSDEAVEFGYSVARQVAPVGSGQRLQSSRSSYADLIRGVRSPGAVP